MAGPDSTMQAVTAEIPPINSLTVEQARQGYRQYLEIDEEIADIGDVHDTTISELDSDIPVRIYEPVGTGARPLVVWMHGGGFILGDVESYDPTCRALCDVLDAVVVSVDYRRAPEHPFPAAVEDCYVATEWAAESAEQFGANPDRLVVAGDSAGGNLAASVAQLARDKDGPSIHHQALIYPTTTFKFGFDTESEPNTDFFLTEPDLEWSWELYLDNELHGMTPYASPLQARSVAGLPPATIITCTFDPLHDEGVEYANRLEEAGVEVSHTNYDEMIHSFITLLAEPRIEQAWDALEFIRASLYDEPIGE